LITNNKILYPDPTIFTNPQPGNVHDSQNCAADNSDMATAANLCNECESAAGLSCSRCHSIRYDSKACQQLSWPLHKHLCKTYKGFQGRPEADHLGETFTRAIIFHPDESHPRFIWFILTSTYQGYQGPDRDAFREALMVSEVGMAPGTHISGDDSHFSHNDLLDRELDHTFRMRYSDQPLHRESRTNKSPRGVIEMPGQPFVDKFGGPIIVYGTNTGHGSGPEAKHGVNLTPADLRHIADFFECFGVGNLPRAGETAKEAYRQMRSMRRKLLKYKLFDRNEAMFTGVHINCDGNMLNSCDRYAPFPVPTSYLIFY
jgi:hypothetical protein